MIFKEKEYQILVESFEIYNREQVESNVYSFIYETSRFFNFNRPIPKNREEIKLLIDNNDYTQIPYLELSISNMSRNYNRIPKEPFIWILKQDKDLIKIIQEQFMKAGIDIINELQRLSYNYMNINKKSNEDDYSRKYMDITKVYYYMILKNNYDFCRNAEAQELFEKTVEQAVSMYQQDYHKIALGLIKKAIEKKYKKDNIIMWFKSFLNVNKTISPQVKKDFDFIKESIKDWDISKYFNTSEQNILYNSQDGMMAKKIEGLFYSLDLNVIKLKNKIKSKTMGTNIRQLTNILPEILGDLPNYIGINTLFNDPLVTINILFEKGIKEEKLNAINLLIESVINTTQIIEEEEMKTMVKITILNNFLNETLKEKEGVKTIRNKI